MSIKPLALALALAPAAIGAAFADETFYFTTGDFNLFPSGFGNAAGAPTTFAPFTQQINGDKLGLVSLTVSPTVPEPSSWALMLVGFAGLGLAGFRRARRTALAD